MRALCARFIDAQPEEIALLGPTSLGLSLFANGLPWQEGDAALKDQNARVRDAAASALDRIERTETGNGDEAHFGGEEETM